MDYFELVDRAFSELKFLGLEANREAAVQVVVSSLKIDPIGTTFSGKGILDNGRIGKNAF